MLSSDSAVDITKWNVCYSPPLIDIILSLLSSYSLATHSSPLHFLYDYLIYYVSEKPSGNYGNYGNSELQYYSPSEVSIAKGIITAPTQRCY